MLSDEDPYGFRARAPSPSRVDPRPTRSQPRMRSALAGRDADRVDSVLASRRCGTWLNTEPPFWASPAMSIMTQPLPSRWAAMPRIRVDGDRHPCRRRRSTIEAPACRARAEIPAGAGTHPSPAGRCRARPSAFCLQLHRRAPSRRTGRSPRGRKNPCCSSAGRCGAGGRTPSPAAAPRRSSTFTPQSPQPSQTSSLMTTRLADRRPGAALAAAALLGGAGLVVDQHRDALDLAELALHRRQLVAVLEPRRARRGFSLRSGTAPLRRRRSRH